MENRGIGGIDGQSFAAFEAQLGRQLARLQRELEEDTYRNCAKALPSDADQAARLCGGASRRHQQLARICVPSSGATLCFTRKCIASSAR